MGKSNLRQDDVKLSVIIPVYNVEPYLRQCLDSIVNQTYRNLEIILVDDGSPDNCGAICNEYAQKDDRIIVIHKENGGLSAARNDGVDRATGEWVTFVDSDDWCDLDYYERLLGAIKNQNIDIFCAGGHFMEYSNTRIERRAFTKSVLFEGREQADFLMAKVFHVKLGDCESKDPTGTAGPWDKLYKLSFMRENQLKYYTTLHAMEDCVFNFIAFDKARRVEVCDHIGYHYRQGNLTSINHRFNPQALSTFVVLTNCLNDYMQRREPNEMIQYAIDIGILTAFAYSAKHYFFHKDNPNPYRVTANEVQKLKLEPAFHDVIHRNNNDRIPKKRLILKRLLRLPWVWPLKLAYGVRQMLPER